MASGSNAATGERFVPSFITVEVLGLGDDEQEERRRTQER
jgi:hypothetical protein